MGLTQLGGRRWLARPAIAVCIILLLFKRNGDAANVDLFSGSDLSSESTSMLGVALGMEGSSLDSVGNDDVNAEGAMLNTFTTSSNVRVRQPKSAATEIRQKLAGWFLSSWKGKLSK